MAIYIALKKLPMGGGKILPAGSLVPQAAGWRRLDVSIDRGEVLKLPDETVAEIVRQGLTEDLLDELALRVADLTPTPKPKKLKPRDEPPAGASPPK